MNRIEISPPARNVIVSFSGLILTMLLAALDGTIVATALPTIASQLGGFDRIAWVITAYLLAETVATPIWGKLGDLYGRKRMLELGILIFLIGSALCGAAPGIIELVLARAVQGIGGGAIMVTTQAAIGDIVAPRERGRYQGFFGAVFGLASIAGPLVGGYFTSHLSWRWIFYVNIPLGVVSIIVLAITFPAKEASGRRSIDIIGATLLGIALASFVLLIDLIGIQKTLSAWVYLLGMVSLIALMTFFIAERRARDPILPLEIFRHRTVWAASLIGFVAGFLMFGTVTCLPLFLQAVKGESPVTAGLNMLPLMAGIPAASILTGQFIARTGQYRFFPVAGMALAGIGLFFMSRMSMGTPMPAVWLFMLALGVGIGMTFQVLIIAVQNAIPYRNLGAATSSAILFRFIGGSIGTAALGTLLATGLAERLAFLSPDDAAAISSAIAPKTVGALTQELQGIRATAVMESLNNVFLVTSMIACAGSGIGLLLPHVQLRETIAASNNEVVASVSQSLSMPTDQSSAMEVTRGISVIAERDRKRKAVEKIIRAAGIPITAEAACLLLHSKDGWIHDANHSATTSSILSQLQRAGYVVNRRTDQGGEAYWLTPEGEEVLSRINRSRIQHITDVCAEWDTGPNSEYSEELREIAQAAVSDG